MKKTKLSKRTWMDSAGKRTTDPSKGVLLLGGPGKELTQAEIDAVAKSAKALKKRNTHQVTETPVKKPPRNKAASAPKKKTS